MKASYYSDPVRGKVYRRSYDTLEEAKAYRDEFYAWYQAQVPAPNAHLIKDGEGWAVEMTSAQLAQLLKDLSTDVRATNPEKVRDIRFLWARETYTDPDNGVERDGIVYALGFLWKNFYTGGLRWESIVSDVYGAWKGPESIPDASTRATYEQVLMECLHDGMRRHTLHPAEVKLSPQYRRIIIKEKENTLSLTYRYPDSEWVTEDWNYPTRESFARHLLLLGEELAYGNTVVPDSSPFARRVSWLCERRYFTPAMNPLEPGCDDVARFCFEVLTGVKKVHPDLYVLQDEGGRTVQRVAQGRVQLGDGAGVKMTWVKARRVMDEAKMGPWPHVLKMVIVQS